MPAFLLPFVSMIIGHYGSEAGAALLRRLFAGTAEKLTPKIASGLTSAVLGNSAGKAAEKGLASVASKLPAWAASKVGVAPVVENAVGFGSTAAKMGMFTGASMLADNALGALESSRNDRSIDGWEMYQQQPNPGASEQARSIAAIQDHAEQAHMERALQEMLAARKEDQQRFGGLF